MMHVQFEVQLAKGELAHHGAGGAEIAGGDEFFEETCRHGITGFKVVGKEVQAFAFPAEVLHDLGGQLDKIPINADAIQGGNFNAAAELMQEVAKLMEHGADFVMSEQGGLVIQRGGHVAADEAEVQATVLTVGGGDAHFKVVHPGSTALGVARMPVGIEGADVGAFFVADFIKFDGGMPDFDGAGFGGAGADGGVRRFLIGIKENGVTRSDAQIEHALGQLEHAAEDLVEREPGAELFGVEVILGAALFFRPVGDLPRLKKIRSAVLSVGAVLLELDGFFFEGWTNAFVQVVDEFQSGAAGAGHALLEDLVGKMRLAEELGLFMAEGENLPDQRGIVVFWRIADAGGGLPDLAADVLVLEVFQDGDERGGLQGKAELGRLRRAMTFGLGLLAGGVDGALGEAREASGVVDDEVPGIRGVQDILGVLLGETGELGLDFFEALFFVRREFRAMLTETFHGFIQRTAADTGEGFGLFGFAVSEEQIPNVGIQGDFGVKRGDGGEHRVMSLPQGWRVAEGIEVVDEAPGLAEAAGGFVEGQDDGFKGQTPAVLGEESVNGSGGIFKGGADVCLNVLGGEGGPADVKVRGEERVGHA